jgi:hypothetical protein
MESMLTFGRPSLTKDLIGVAVLSLTVILLWVESALAAGGSAAVAPAADAVDEDAVVVTTTVAPAGADLPF